VNGCAPRLAAEPRLRAAMAKGHALPQCGELQREATSRLAQRLTSLERERQLAALGARVGNGRAAAFRRRRQLRAVALGFASYYRGAKIPTPWAQGRFQRNPAQMLERLQTLIAP
jgi:hypothetical protein